LEYSCDAVDRVIEQLENTLHSPTTDESKRKRAEFKLPDANNDDLISRSEVSLLNHDWGMTQVMEEGGVILLHGGYVRLGGTTIPDPPPLLLSSSLWLVTVQQLPEVILCRPP